jgi:hypothetical protein
MEPTMVREDETLGISKSDRIRNRHQQAARTIASLVQNKRPEEEIFSALEAVSQQDGVDAVTSLENFLHQDSINLTESEKEKALAIAKKAASSYSKRIASFFSSPNPEQAINDTDRQMALAMANNYNSHAGYEKAITLSPELVVRNFAGIEAALATYEFSLSVLQSPLSIENLYSYFSSQTVEGIGKLLQQGTMQDDERTKLIWFAFVQANALWKEANLIRGISCNLNGNVDTFTNRPIVGTYEEMIEVKKRETEASDLMQGGTLDKTAIADLAYLEVAKDLYQIQEGLLQLMTNQEKVDVALSGRDHRE